MIRFVILFLSLGCSSSFAETNYQKEIENFAESLIFSKYTQLYQQNSDQKIAIHAAPLDKRITYPLCETALNGKIVSNKLKKNNSVKVSCNNATPWSTYVRVKFELLSAIMVTKQAINKGQTLNKGNMERIFVNKSKLRKGSFSTLSSLKGSRLKRNVSSARIIQERDVCFVCKDDKVTISAIKSGLVIKASGIALSDANIGSSVRVKNMRSQRIVVGTVSALKEVTVVF